MTIQELRAELLIAAAQALVANDLVPGTASCLRQHPIASPEPAPVLSAAEELHLADLAVIHWAGFASHYDGARSVSAWPVPAIQTHEALARFALERGVLVVVPRVGDIALLWSPVRRCFIRAAIVTSVALSADLAAEELAFDCMTVGARLTECGEGAAGSQVRLARQRFVPSRGDRFVRWIALGEQPSPADEIQLRLAA